MYRDIKIRTVAEDVTLKTFSALTLEEVLRVKRIPPSLFQGYTNNEGVLKPIPLNTRIFNIPHQSEIILRCIRNTDLRDILPQKTFHNKVNDPVTTVSDLSLGGKECIETIYEISAESAKEIVKDKVSDFIETYSQADLIVVGISGGGDSNTLVEAFKKISIKNPKKEYQFFTIVFDPIWPMSAAKRATELCRTNNVPHHVYDANALKKLLNMKDDIEKCYTEYCHRFGSNTNHFFGTYLISLVARKLCQEHQTNEYILGFNREDILAELLFSLMNGQKPLAFPVRQFGKIKLLMPLWEIPKLMLDACYPKYSLSNYQEREEDESTFQRNLIYYLAHGIDDVYPNLGLSLMQGVRQIFENNWPKLKREEDMDLYVSEYADNSKIDEVKEFIRKYFNS